MTDDLVGRQTVHVRDDLDAYYFGFEPTGNADVDRILGAIAYAGKAYHHTEDWDDASVIGVSCVGNIQNAAALATARIEALEAALKTIVTRNRERTWTATDDNLESHWVEQDGQYAKIARAALTPEAPHAD